MILYSVHHRDNRHTRRDGDDDGDFELLKLLNDRERENQNFLLKIFAISNLTILVVSEGASVIIEFVKSVISLIFEIK